MAFFFVFLINFMDMEDYEMLEDDEFDAIFVTQSSGSDKVVSLEETHGENWIQSQKYSDISDSEDEMETRLR